MSTSFQSVCGTSYRLERKPTLDSPQIFMFPPRPGTGEDMHLSDPNPPAGGAFYQVREVQ
jgi:hypothetical protein